VTGNRQLMRLHVEALFTHDVDGRLVRVNEPDGAHAPRFFLGRTVDGSVRRFRHDVDDDLREELEAASGDEALQEHALGSPMSPSRYEDILARFVPIQSKWSGPAFCFPQELRAGVGTILVTQEYAQLLHPSLQGWVHDLGLCQPMVALTADGQAVALCCSVRRTSVAHEAGVETALRIGGAGTRRTWWRRGHRRCVTWAEFLSTARRGRTRRREPSRASLP